MSPQTKPSDSKGQDDVASLKAAFRFQEGLLDNLAAAVPEPGIRLPTESFVDNNSMHSHPLLSDFAPASFDLSLSLGSGQGLSSQLMSSMMGSLQLPTISHSQALAQTPAFYAGLLEPKSGDSPVGKRRKSNQKPCNFPDCPKLAHGPDYKFCLRHGGGYRCQMPGCPRSAYSTKYCSKHGGGPRCQFQACIKGAISNSSFCRRHGGGPRCQHPNCTEGARAGFNYCLSHGGYNPCAFPSCPCPALHTSSYCRQHNSYQRKMANAQVMALSGLTSGIFNNPLDDYPHHQ